MHTSEGTVESIDYVFKVCACVEATYSLWHGTRRAGSYVEQAPVRYNNVTREQAFTRLVYALNTGAQSVNPFKCPYSNIHTREVQEDDTNRLKSDAQD